MITESACSKSDSVGAMRDEWITNGEGDEEDDEEEDEEEMEDDDEDDDIDDDDDDCLCVFCSPSLVCFSSNEDISLSAAPSPLTEIFFL